MNPTLARGAVILLSFIVLGISAVLTAGTWELLEHLHTLPRGLVSLGVFVTSYYLGANFIFWRSVLRISGPAQPASAP